MFLTRQKEKHKTPCSVWSGLPLCSTWAARTRQSASPSCRICSFPVHLGGVFEDPCPETHVTWMRHTNSRVNTIQLVFDYLQNQVSVIALVEGTVVVGQWLRLVVYQEDSLPHPSESPARLPFTARACFQLGTHSDAQTRKCGWVVAQRFINTGAPTPAAGTVPEEKHSASGSSGSQSQRRPWPLPAQLRRLSPPVSDTRRQKAKAPAVPTETRIPSRGDRSDIGKIPENTGTDLILAGQNIAKVTTWVGWNDVVGVVHDWEHLTAEFEHSIYHTRVEEKGFA